MAEFNLATLAKVVKDLYDHMTELTAASEKNSSATITADRNRLRAARDSLSKLMGDEEEPGRDPTHGRQESARDSRPRVANDSRGRGVTSPFAGCGDYVPSRVDTRYSLDTVLVSSEGAAPLDHSLSSVFKTVPVLGEG